MPWSRRSRHEQGYGSNWVRIRLIVLRRDCGLCQCEYCKARGLVTVATEVDHKRPKSQGGTDNLSNLRAVAHECHQRITAEQQGHTYTPRPPQPPRPRIGPDGYPIEA